MSCSTDSRFIYISNQRKSTAGNDETDKLRNGEDADVEESESDNGRGKKKTKKAKTKVCPVLYKYISLFMLQLGTTGG